MYHRFAFYREEEVAAIGDIVMAFEIEDRRLVQDSGPLMIFAGVFRDEVRFPGDVNANNYMPT